MALLLLVPIGFWFHDMVTDTPVERIEAAETCEVLDEIQSEMRIDAAATMADDDPFEAQSLLRDQKSALDKMEDLGCQYATSD